MNNLRLMVFALCVSTMTATQAFAAFALEVTPGIYRSARPTEIDLESLPALGITTIINLESDKKAVAREAKVAARLGIKMISLPMSGFLTPKDKTVNKVLEVLSNAANEPVLIHCKFGRDRTGLTVALFRVEHQAWAPETAYDEMIKLGFREALFNLKNYYEDRTGYDAVLKVANN